MANNLEVKLSIIDSGFDKFKELENNTNSLSNKISGLSSTMSTLSNVAKGAGIALTAGLGAATAAYASIVKPALEYADTLQKQADITGLNTKTLQEYIYVAKQSGSTSEALTTGISKLSENAYKAATGNKALSDTFKNLGINLKDSSGNLRSSNDIVNDTINKLADLKNPTEQSALAIQLLGKGGRDLVPMLRGGSEAIAQMREEASTLGQVLSDEAIKNLDKAGDSLDMLGNRLKVSLAEGVNQALPSLEALVSGLDKVIGALSNAAQGWGWLINGRKKFDEEMSKSDALTKELQDMIALKKEYESIIGAQESFKAKKSDLFNEETLIEYTQALENLKQNIKDLNKQSPDKVTNNNTIVGGNDEANIKKLNTAKIKLQNEYYSDWEKLGKDAQKTFEKQEDEKRKKLKEYQDNDKKDKADILQRNKKLDTDLEKLQVESIRDEQARRKANVSYISKQADKLYSEQVKDAKGNANEIAKAEKIKYLTIANANADYESYLKSAEQSKLAMQKETARNTLDMVTNTLQSAATKHKEAAVAYKALAISTTIIDTMTGAQKAFNSLASIPVVGYALGLAASIATVGAGLYRVNEIRKQQFFNGGRSRGGLALVGEMGPEYVTLPVGSQVYNHHQSNMINNNQNNGTTINLTIQREDGSVAEKLSRAIRNGSDSHSLNQIKKYITGGK